MQLPLSRMAKRGMLPKFRPATLGRDAQARPSIRPVKPGPPPPPPSPPRRISSGFGPRSNIAAFAQTALENDLDAQLEASTVVGNGEPSTLNRGPETVPLEPARNPRRGRADGNALSFDDETQARPVDDRLLDKLRREDAVAANAHHAPRDLGVDYESLPSLEVRRPFDTYEAAFSERDPVTQLHAAARESVRVRRGEQGSYNEPPVAYEDPVYSDEPQTPAYRDREPSYNEPSYREPSYPASASHHVDEEQDMWGRREESGPRERPLPPPARSYAAPVPSYDDASDSAQWGRDRAQPPSHRAQQQGWSSMPPEADDSRLDQPMIPPAPRLPEEMHPAFARGVQPIRTATPDAWGTPHVAPPPAGQYLPSPMQAIHSSLPPQYAQNQQQYPAYAYQHQYAQPQPQLQYQPQPTAYAPSPQQYLQAGQRQPTPMPMNAGAMSPMSPSMMDRMQRAQPVGGQLATQPPAANGKIGRFAWFVAGAAFGITFAFFATGFFNGAAAKSAGFDAPVAPVVTATTATTAAAPTAPPVAGAPVAPVALAAPAPVTPASLPAVAPAPAAGATAAATANANAAPAAAPAPVAHPAPPPRAPRFQAPPPRRPSAPASQAPKNLGGGGPGADDDRPSAPPAAPPGADLGDLLGAGLKP